MAILRAKEVTKMSPNDKKEKLKELKMELIRANVTANKSNIKTKEIKRAISRLLTSFRSGKNILVGKSTFNKSAKEELKNK